MKKFLRLNPSNFSRSRRIIPKPKLMQKNIKNDEAPIQQPHKPTAPSIAHHQSHTHFINLIPNLPYETNKPLKQNLQPFPLTHSLTAAHLILSHPFSPQFAQSHNVRLNSLPKRISLPPFSKKTSNLTKPSRSYAGPPWALDWYTASTTNQASAR